MPAEAAPLAKMVRAAIADIATTWLENTPKQAHRMTTLRMPATTLYPASAPIRAAARCLLRLRGLPINPIRVEAMYPPNTQAITA
jgi:hypothetical protein